MWGEVWAVGSLCEWLRHLLSKMVEKPLNDALCTPMRIGIAWMRDGCTQWVSLSAPAAQTSDAESARGTQRIV